MCVEVFNKNSKIIVLNLAYRPPNGDPNEIENHFKNILSKREITNKELVLVGDFNINVLDFNESKMVQNFVNLMFRHGLIPTINKPTRVTRNTATAIDHIITNSVINAEFKTGIIKTDISDHFPIFFIFKCVVDSTEAREEFIYKRNYSSNSIETFKQKLREVNWNEVKQSNNANESYAKFSEICTSLYEECFPKFKIKLNQRKNLSPWITKGIKKSSKRKQKLYEKFLKKRNAFNETAYKTYKNLFEAIKRKSKKNHYSQKILQFKYDIKKRWNVMKEIIGKAKHSKKSNFPQKLKIGNKIKTGENEIANEFNKYFADIGPSLAKNIPKPSIPFESFLKRVNTTMPSQCLSTN